MTSLYQIQNRYRFSGLLMLGVVIVLGSLWGIEFHYAVSDVTARQEQHIREQQERLIEAKAEEVRALFHEIYQSARTISLLPMVREMPGANRKSEAEDVVSQGRYSRDTHRTLQQIYTSLENNVRVSEIYYVLDGFDPEHDIPAFMYDNHIAGINEKSGNSEQPADDIPQEVEEEEYQYFPVHLAWFRDNAPHYRWSHDLDGIPARISPLLRTCDNSQYNSIRHGNVTDSHGLIFSFPVYTPDSLSFKGIITVVLRANVLEARLLGIPFLPITAQEVALQRQQGWKMPAISTFQLQQPEHGILIQDRRATAAAHDNDKGRWLKREYQFDGGVTWSLRHHLDHDTITQMSSAYAVQRQAIISSRIFFIIIVGAILTWSVILLLKSRNELFYTAYYDDLTKLPNRAQLLNYIQKRIDTQAAKEQRIAVIIINIESFSSINQLYGHLTGDIVLCKLAHRLKESIDVCSTTPYFNNPIPSDSTMLARISGDEYAIVSTDFASKRDIQSLVHQLQDKMAEPIAIDSSIQIKTSIYIGIALFPDDADTTSQLLAAANAALQECRQRGSDIYYQFDSALQQQHERINRLSEASKLALDAEQFELMYQPKQSLHDGTIVSLEALLRWRHPQLGYISPAEFIPILEENKEIIGVGFWVLQRACSDIARLDALGFNTVAISVNVSVRQLYSESFCRDVEEILTTSATDPSRIILEITESVMMENMESGIDTLQQLHRLGLPIAIDDFGTGYSSLTYLQNLPLTYLKLDKAFIDGMVDEGTTHIVRMVIELAKGLHLITIAEGIESEEQKELLSRLGCDIIQGYLLSKPKPLREILDWLRNTAPDL